MISSVYDDTITAFLEHDLCALIVARSTCDQCISYIGDVRQLVESGALGDTRVGVMMLDQPGVSLFRLENPWLASVHILPYTMLFRKGERVDGFSAQPGHSLVDHSWQPDLAAMS